MKITPLFLLALIVSCKNNEQKTAANATHSDSTHTCMSVPTRFMTTKGNNTIQYNLMAILLQKVWFL